LSGGLDSSLVAAIAAGAKVVAAIAVARAWASAWVLIGRIMSWCSLVERRAAKAYDGGSRHTFRRGKARAAPKDRRNADANS
jgi:asparagine synthetase B (glutamine-hydrolysing)